MADKVETGETEAFLSYAEVEYKFEVWQDDFIQVGGHASTVEDAMAEAANPRFGVTQEPPNPSCWTGFACEAYLLADAMLAARQQP